MSDGRQVTIQIDFEKTEHGIVGSSGTLSLNGVPTGPALDSILGVVEEAIGHELSQLPKVRELLGWQFPLGADGTLFNLEQDTQALILKLLSHQVLLGRVAGRKYVTTAISARLSLPYDG